MPRIYLSPSVQQANIDVNGVSEETMMNYIADAMEPYLRLNGVGFSRNRPSMSLSEVIAHSNREDYDLHLGLHSNAAPPTNYGGVRGSWAYYQEGSREGKEYAEIFAEHMKELYPLPDRVRTIPVTQLAELSRTLAPAVLYEIAFHDNFEDSAFITNNVQNIAENLSESLLKIFGKDMIPVCILGTSPAASYRGGLIYGRVCTQSGGLNLRDRPGGNVILALGQGERLMVLGPAVNGWSPVRYNAINGYADARYLCVCNNPALPFSARLGTVSTDGSGLNVRRTPSSQAPVLARAENSAPIVVLGDNDDYYRVDYRGIPGYAAREFIELP